ncbi:MAG: hypothetical protein AB7Q00_13125 [Phycisphaerales bacterium]
MDTTMILAPAIAMVIGLVAGVVLFARSEPGAPARRRAALVPLAMLVAFVTVQVIRFGPPGFTPTELWEASLDERIVTTVVILGLGLSLVTWLTRNRLTWAAPLGFAIAAALGVAWLFARLGAKGTIDWMRAGEYAILAGIVAGSWAWSVGRVAATPSAFRSVVLAGLGIAGVIGVLATTGHAKLSEVSASVALLTLGLFLATLVRRSVAGAGAIGAFVGGFGAFVLAIGVFYETPWWAAALAVVGVPLAGVVDMAIKNHTKAWSRFILTSTVALAPVLPAIVILALKAKEDSGY